MGRKTVTMADIAARAGVSTVSVSKALSGQKGVSPEMRAHICFLAEEMGYRKFPRNFSGKEEPVTIGIVVSARFMEEEKSFYWSVIQEITKNAFEKGLFCILEAVEAEDEETGRTPGLLKGGKADGLIILGSFQPEYEACLVRDAKLPLIFVDSRPSDPGCDAVISDNYTGGRIMTEYLIRMGHRKIAFVGTLLVTSSIDERYFGYCRALMGHGISYRGDFVIPDRDVKEGVIDPERFFQLPEEMPDAFFCNCDRSALFMIRKLEKAGFRIPQDISVVGYDNFLPGGDVEEAGITTYALDLKEIARKTVHMISHKIRSSYSYGCVSVCGYFMERQSAGPPISGRLN